MIPRIGKIFQDDHGVAALEYALIAGLMFAIIVSAVNLGLPLKTVFTNIGSTLTSHASGS
jgi:Flp pilus assembly pilin Flp